MNTPPQAINRPTRWAGNTRDDRGIDRGVIAVHTLRRDPRCADARFRLVVERVRGQVLSRMRRPLIGLIAGFCGPLVMIGTIRLGLPVWLGIVMIASIAVTLGRVLYLRGLRTGAAATATVMLTDGLCPSCAYSFAGLGPGGDGCFECPECGAAWLATRVLRRTRFEEQAGGGGFAAPVPWWHRVGRGVGARSLKDDRGRAGSAVDARLRDAIRATDDPAARERLIAARRRMLREGIIARVGLFLFYVCLAGLQLLPLVQTPARARTLLGALTLVGAAFMVWLGFMFLRSNVGIRKKSIRREMLTRGFCPACAAQLAGVGPDSDGCAACRECGAAWTHAEIAVTPPA